MGRGENRPTGYLAGFWSSGGPFQNNGFPGDPGGCDGAGFGVPDAVAALRVPFLHGQPIAPPEVWLLRSVRATLTVVLVRQPVNRHGEYGNGCG